MNSRILAAIGFVVAALMGLMLMRSQTALRAARAEAEQARAEKAELSTKLTEAESAAVKPSELARLRAEQQEAIRLRGELTRLKQQATAAARNAAAAPAPNASSNQQPQTEEPVQPVQTQTFTLQARGAIPMGSTMTVGGWETKPGVHTFAFVTPVQSGDTLQLQARWIEGPREVVSSLNEYGQAVARGSRMLTPEQSAAFIAALEQTPGVNVLAAPTVETISGRESHIAVGNQVPGPNGTFVHVGPELTLTPIVGANGMVDLSANAKVTVQVEQ